MNTEGFARRQVWVGARQFRLILANGGQQPESAPKPRLFAAAIPFLNRRALGVAVRTVHATIAFPRFQELAATFALIEELTRVRRHHFSLGVPALWAGDCRIQFHECNRVKFVTGRYRSVPEILPQSTQPSPHGQKPTLIRRVRHFPMDTYRIAQRTRR